MAFGIGSSQATAYEPTVRDKIALKLEDLLGSGPVARHFVDGLMGGTGLGRQHTGLADWIPGLSQVMQGDEAGQQIAAGHPWAGTGNLALAAVPIPAVGKGFGFVSKKVAQAADGAVGRAAVKTAEQAEPIIAYHGSPTQGLTSLQPRKQLGTFDFPGVVSLATDRATAARYAGADGAIYAAKVSPSGLGDFRDPADVQKVVEFYRRQEGSLAPADVARIEHGAWALWENPELWKAQGWKGAWTREEPGRGDAGELNLSLADGRGIDLLPDIPVKSPAASSLPPLPDLNRQAATVQPPAIQPR